MPQPSTHPLLAALNRDWAALSSHPVPTAWRLAYPGFAGVDVADVPDIVRADPDGALLALLRLQASGDGVAGRAVVQCLLPKMVLMASRDPAASLDDYVGALWVRISAYPLGRRRQKVAANLALDTLKTVKSSSRQQAGWLPHSAPDPLSDAVAVLAVGVRLGVIDALTLRVMTAVYIEGRTSAAAGQVLGVSADAVRWRCSRGVRALRTAVPDLVEALAA